ncbi:MAG: DUF3465 domain-containing protein [Ruminococcus sp.]|jgi:hypothetical protein|nr:DUF3465 domain-containing protein [Ruminococcus sp.]
MIKKSIIIVISMFMFGLTACGLSETEMNNAATGILSAIQSETSETTVKTTEKKAGITETAEDDIMTAETTAAETATVTTTTAPATTTVTTTTVAPVDNEAEYIKSLFDSQSSDVWVTGSGVVTRVLKDDNEGDRHQRFILELSTGQTLLFAHNIDIAPRIDDIAKGDIISFYGEYIFSDEGGTVHWTHHDPDGSSDGGWLKKGDTVYK